MMKNVEKEKHLGEKRSRRQELLYFHSTSGYGFLSFFFHPHLFYFFSPHLLKNSIPRAARSVSLIQCSKNGQHELNFKGKGEDAAASEAMIFFRELSR